MSLLIQSKKNAFSFLSVMGRLRLMRGDGNLPQKGGSVSLFGTLNWHLRTQKHCL